MFQNVNVAKSAPFALLTIYQKSLYPPKFLNCPPFRQIMRNSPTIFRFEQQEMEPSKFTANCAKITQFTTPSHKSREIRAILVKFYQPSLPICTPTFFTANVAKFAQFMNTQSERLEINQFRANLNKSSIFIFQTLVRQDPTPCLCELREFRNLKLKFTKMPLLISLHNILTL